MNTGRSRTPWPTYTSFVNALARVDSNFQWLSHFFSRNRQGDSLGGNLNIIESSTSNIKDHACSLDDLQTPPKLGNTRIVVLSYEESWALDRKVLDKIAISLNLPPFFLWHHLEYEGNRSEKAFPEDLRGWSNSRPYSAASKVKSLEIGWTPFFHMSGMVASPATASAGATCKKFKLGKTLLDLTDSRTIS